MLDRRSIGDDRSEAIEIYADLAASDIGISYLALCEDYAALLEGDGRYVGCMLVVSCNKIC